VERKKLVDAERREGRATSSFPSEPRLRDRLCHWRIMERRPSVSNASHPRRSTRRNGTAASCSPSRYRGRQSANGLPSDGRCRRVLPRLDGRRHHRGARRERILLRFALLGGNGGGGRRRSRVGVSSTRVRMGSSRRCHGRGDSRRVAR
jgi:hypothetical protein